MSFAGEDDFSIKIIRASLATLLYLIVWWQVETKIWRKIEAGKQKKERLYKFCVDCRRFKFYSIEDLRTADSDEKKSRVAMLLKKYGYNLEDQEFVQEFNTMATEVATEYAASAEQFLEKKRLEEEKKKKEEEEKLTKLIYYAQFQGQEKPERMFRDLAKKERGDVASYMPMQKESDGMLLAGAAAGIGGLVPALNSLAHTARNNEGISEHNKMVLSFNSLMADANYIRQRTAEIYEEKADRLSYQLIGNLMNEEIFQSLEFTNTQTQVSELGSVIVETEVFMKDKINVFDQPGFADGYVIAEIYEEGGEARKVGEAVMVFPAYGSLFYKIESSIKYMYAIFKKDDQKPVQLKGMCLDCGNPDKAYIVKFIPGNLWVMQQ